MVCLFHCCNTQLRPGELWLPGTASRVSPSRISEEEDLHLGTSFSAETNRRDEDADM